MAETTEPLVLDLVEWVAKRPKPYAEVLDAWRTSCPRMPIWEDAVSERLVALCPQAGGGMNGAVVELTDRGRTLLARAA